MLAPIPLCNLLSFILFPLLWLILQALSLRCLSASLHLLSASLAACGFILLLLLCYLACALFVPCAYWHTYLWLLLCATSVTVVLFPSCFLACICFQPVHLVYPQTFSSMSSFPCALCFSYTVLQSCSHDNALVCLSFPVYSWCSLHAGPDLSLLTPCCLYLCRPFVQSIFIWAHVLCLRPYHTAATCSQCFDVALPSFSILFLKDSSPRCFTWAAMWWNHFACASSANSSTMCFIVLFRQAIFALLPLHPDPDSHSSREL